MLCSVTVGCAAACSGNHRAPAAVLALCTALGRCLCTHRTWTWPCAPRPCGAGSPGRRWPPGGRGARTKSSRTQPAQGGGQWQGAGGLDSQSSRCRLPASPAVAPRSSQCRLGALCAAGRATFHLHSVPQQQQACTHRLQRGASELGLGSGRRGRAHDQAAAPADNRRPGALRREHGGLESEGSHSVALVKPQPCAGR